MDTLKAMAKAANSAGKEKINFRENYDKWGWIDELAADFFSKRKRKNESPAEYFKNHSFAAYLKNNKTARYYLKDTDWGTTTNITFLKPSKKDKHKKTQTAAEYFRTHNVGADLAKNPIAQYGAEKQARHLGLGR